MYECLTVGISAACLPADCASLTNFDSARVLTYMENVNWLVLSMAVLKAWLSAMKPLQLPVIFALSACVFAIRRNVGVTFLAHLILLFVYPVFTLAFWMAMGALQSRQPLFSGLRTCILNQQ